MTSSQSGCLATLFVNYADAKLPVAQPIIFTLSLFTIFALLTFFTLKKTVKDELFSFLQTEQMKGLAIIMVIVSHLYGFVIKDYAELRGLRILGSAGVALFLLLSGFGISISLQEKGVKNFFSKRVLRIYIPVVFAMTLEVFLNHVLLKQSSNIFLDLAKIFTIVSAIDRNLWFVIYIFFWYCLIYLAFRMKMPNNGKVIFLCCVSLILITLPHLSPSWKINAFSFPLGCWLGLNSTFFVNKLKLLLHQNILILLSILICGFLLTPCLNNVSDNFMQPGNLGIAVIVAIACLVGGIYSIKKQVKFDNFGECLSFCLAILAMLSYLKWVLNDTITGEKNIAGWMFGSLACLTLAGTIVLLATLMLKYQVYSIFMKFVGKISFELYLIHGMFMYTYDFILFRENILLSFFIYFAAICLGSIVLQRLSSFTFNCISNFEPSRMLAGVK